LHPSHLNALTLARSSVRVLAYELTSTPIVSALVAAHSRGVDVQVVVDAMLRRSVHFHHDVLTRACVPLTYDPAHHIAHNKVIILDNSLVITGSFNFTDSAEYHNAENLLLISSPEVAALYAANWQLHRSHSAE
jgi:phosphatidylserine/phosphatidylglycerophosphate/cardiolipin synthase-like enzyme